MKKLIIILLLCCCSLFMDNIYANQKNWINIIQSIFKDDEIIMQEKAENILQNIKDKNSKKIITMFCPNIVIEYPTLEKDVNKLISKFDCETYQIIKIISYEEGIFGDSKGIIQQNVSCTIKINDNEYKMSFIFIKKNYSNKKDIGLYSLEIIEMGKVIKNTKYFDEMTPGIYNSID